MSHTAGTVKYRDFSEMPDDVLRSFANALAEIAKNSERKASRKARAKSGSDQS